MPADTPNEFSQLQMVHRLPKAKLANRIEYLTELARGKRVAHVGFVDAGCQQMQHENDAWLHGFLDKSATSLVGLDVDKQGVDDAKARGFEAYAVDCRSRDAVAALGLDPADLVIAGEVIEHLDDPGSFLDAMHAVAGTDGSLVLTTPNATGILNGVAAIPGYEVNHPDHVVSFSYATLSTLLGRHGWEVTEVRTFVPWVKELSGAGVKMRLLALGARFVLGLERLLARLGAPFVADGLIVVARPRR